MISIGEEVIIDREVYIVTKTPTGCISCGVCDVHNCYLKRGIQSLKAKHHAYTCEDLIGLHRHFKRKAEGEQQVSPSNQQIA